MTEHMVSRIPPSYVIFATTQLSSYYSGQAHCPHRG